MQYTNRITDGWKSRYCHYYYCNYNYWCYCYCCCFNYMYTCYCCCYHYYYHYYYCYFINSGLIEGWFSIITNNSYLQTAYRIHVCLSAIGRRPKQMEYLKQDVHEHKHSLITTITFFRISINCLKLRIIIDSDGQPETKQGIEGKIDRFRS